MGARFVVLISVMLSLVAVPASAAALTSVEVHWDGLAGSRFTRAGDATSDFSPADAANGTFQLFGSANGAPELGFVKERNTGSGTVEAHWDVLSNGAYHRAGDYISDFSPVDANNGPWQLLSTNSTVPQLGFVKLTQASPAPPQVAPAPPPAAVPVVTVVPQPRARGHVRVRISIAWTWRGKRTWLERIRVGRLSRRGRLTVVCRGRGCPTPHARVTRRRGEGALLASLAGSGYRAGDRIFVTVSVPGKIAERAEIIVRAGKIPVVHLL